MPCFKRKKKKKKGNKDDRYVLSQYQNTALILQNNGMFKCKQPFQATSQQIPKYTNQKLSEKLIEQNGVGTVRKVVKDYNL